MEKEQRTNAKKKGTNGADTLTHVSDDERNTPSPVYEPQVRQDTETNDAQKMPQDGNALQARARARTPVRAFPTAKRREHEPTPRARSRDAVHDQVLVHAHAWKAAPYPRSTLLQPLLLLPRESATKSVQPTKVPYSSPCVTGVRRRCTHLGRTRVKQRGKGSP